MRSSRSYRRDFDPSSLYEYPTHLRDAVQSAPRGAGVYVFHGQEGDLPLYIGKSIRIRDRLLSHLRTADEARMLRQTQRISYIETVGEIGALLLEAQMIKRDHPLFNRKLRRIQQLCSLQLRNGIAEVVYANDMDFSRTADLYGLFSSSFSAVESLRKIADDEKLCYVELGLEKKAPSRGCFRAMIHQCAGVSKGLETREDHLARLLHRLQTLQLNCWPYSGAVGLVEQDEARVQIHVVNNWCYLGSVTNWEDAKKMNTVASGFDADGYKILYRPMLLGTVKVVPLGGAS